jgi:hypothetical protein
MLRSHKYAFAGLAVATLLAAGTGVRTALARESTPIRLDNVALGEEQVRQLLPLMDQDQDGKVSERKCMKYMQAAFKRLSKDGTGELDVKELTRSQGGPITFRSAGK